MTDLLPTQLKESKLSNSAALRQMIHLILILSSLNLLFIASCSKYFTNLQESKHHLYCTYYESST